MNALSVSISDCCLRAPASFSASIISFRFLHWGLSLLRLLVLVVPFVFDDPPLPVGRFRTCSWSRTAVFPLPYGSDAWISAPSSRKEVDSLAKKLSVWEDLFPLHTSAAFCSSREYSFLAKAADFQSFSRHCLRSMLLMLCSRSTRRIRRLS